MSFKIEQTSDTKAVFDKIDRYNSLYCDIAKRVALMSHAVRAKVGCVIVKNGNVISMGWNGMPAGMDNCCEHEVDGILVTNPEVSHAEENAIAKLAKSSTSCNGATLYVTMEPCMHCAKLIYSAGISQVVYMDEYKSHAGVEFLKARGLIVQQHKDL